MACLSSRARYLRGSTGRRGAVSGDGRIWRLAWLIVFAVLVSLRSFFFRQLLAALLLFTILFVVVAALIALCIGIDYAAGSAVSWAESQVRSTHCSTHHSVARPTQVSLRRLGVQHGESRESNAADRVCDYRGAER